MNGQIPDGCILLARQNDFLVYGDQDYVHVMHSDGRKQVIGWMYGNAVAALITWDERYAVIVGCGVMVFDLCRFDEATSSTVPSKTYMMHRLSDPDDIWWFASVEQVFQDVDRSILRLATDITDKHAGIYSLSLPDFEFLPVPHHQPML